ncbi:MAG: hypothetical protein SVV03_05690 [Candidatus Nanohaloarchaea archaeon]|nr:hypothetical protein [Candidatus Nanohaloarchaea archaeon]
MVGRRRINCLEAWKHERLKDEREKEKELYSFTPVVDAELVWVETGGAGIDNKDIESDLKADSKILEVRYGLKKNAKLEA